MTDEKINRAIAETNRFLIAALTLKDARNSSGREFKPKEQGAVKRASMDLTRVLAELRKPD